jgi:phosphoglycolate phosphatase
MPFPFVIFDLDGTLIDSRRDLARSANELIRAHGARPLPEADIIRMVGDGARRLVERAFDAAALGPVSHDHVEQFVAIYQDHLVDSTLPYEGVVDVLRTLAARGPVALITNKPAAPTRRLLDHFGVRDCFVSVTAGEDPYPRKPAPDSTLAAMRAARASALETVFVGDSHVDARTARAAGVHFCFARYGFGADQMPEGLVTPDDWIVDRPLDLLEHLEEGLPDAGASQSKRG